jgi:hypothetical protein
MTLRVNTRLLRKGALVQETFEIMRQWDRTASWKAHLDSVRTSNSIGAKSEKWLKEVVSTVGQRFSEPSSPVLDAMARISRHGLDIEPWLQLLHYHIGTTDALYHRFSTEWLWKWHAGHRTDVATDAVLPWVKETLQKDLSKGSGLSEYGQVRLTRDLLRMATDLRILTPSTHRELRRPSLLPEVVIFLLCLLRDQLKNSNAVLESSVWRIFLWTRDELVQDLIELDQFGRIGYQAAGSITELDLPAASAVAYLDKWLPA